MKIEVYCKVCKTKETLTRMAEEKAKKFGFALCERCGMPMIIKKIKETGYDSKKIKVDE